MPTRSSLGFVHLLVPFSLGFASLLFGSYLVGRLVRAMWDLVPPCGKDGRGKAFDWKAPIMGSVEGIIYLVSLLLGHPEVIGAWLVFKVVGRWQGLKQEEKYPREKAFEVYVTGNGLSIVNAMVAWSIVALARIRLEWLVLLPAAAAAAASGLTEVRLRHRLARMVKPKGWKCSYGQRCEECSLSERN